MSVAPDWAHECGPVRPRDTPSPFPGIAQHAVQGSDERLPAFSWPAFLIEKPYGRIAAGRSIMRQRCRRVERPRLFMADDDFLAVYSSQTNRRLGRQLLSHNQTFGAQVKQMTRSRNCHFVATPLLVPARPLTLLHRYNRRQPYPAPQAVLFMGGTDAAASMCRQVPAGYVGAQRKPDNLPCKDRPVRSDVT